MNYSQLIQKLPLNLKSFMLREPGWIIPNLLITYSCTQRCLQCGIPLKASPEMVITHERVDLICEKLIAQGTQGLSISGGEPLAHPDVTKILSQLTTKSFAFLHLLTNLYGDSRTIESVIELLFKHQIHITTSFDGFGTLADKIRGGKNVSDRVSQSMELISKENARAKRRIQTRATVVISQLNLHQIEDILLYLEKLNWEVSVDIYRCSSVQHLDSDEMHIRDLDKLKQVLDLCVASPNVVTPAFLIRGYLDYLKGDFPKRCPYLESPVLGSKFFIQPNGDVLVCMGNSIGNLLQQTPSEITHSPEWKLKMDEFRNCEGCWNPCYTTFSGLTPLSEMIRGIKRVTRSR